MLSLLQLSKINKSTSDVDMVSIITLILILFILDITLLVYTIYCLNDLVIKGVIQPWLAIILGALLFSPGTGSLVAIGIIVYHTTRK